MTMMIPVQTAGGAEIRINPHFNLRFFFPQIVEAALLGLMSNAWEDWYKTYCQEEGVTEEDLKEAWGRYAQYMASCLTLEEQKGPRDALTSCGFLDCRPEARLVVLAKIGQLVTASIWWPLREGTPMGELPSDAAMLNAMGDSLLGKNDTVHPRT